MIEKRIWTSAHRGFTNLKYDADTYEIEYIDEVKLFLLRRLIDRKILYTFGGNAECIVQHYEKDMTSFVVSEYDEENKCSILKHYALNKAGDFYLRMSVGFCSSNLAECAVSKNSYVVSKFGQKFIYNLHLASELFSEVYVDDRIQNLLGKNVLMVSQEKGNDTIKDTITYGINPDTLEIVTPIWSELQQRYIDVYTKEQIDKINSKDRKWNPLCTDNGRITIYMEVERYLQELACHFQPPKSIYLDEYEAEGFKKKINEDFVKRFIKNK